MFIVPRPDGVRVLTTPYLQVIFGIPVVCRAVSSEYPAGGSPCRVHRVFGLIPAL
jgi:hypothetical protein